MVEIYLVYHYTNTVFIETPLCQHFINTQHLYQRVICKHVYLILMKVAHKALKGRLLNASLFESKITRITGIFYV